MKTTQLTKRLELLRNKAETPRRSIDEIRVQLPLPTGAAGDWAAKRNLQSAQVLLGEVWSAVDRAIDGLHHAHD